MGYVVLALTCVLGALLVGGGLYLVLRGDFPAWWRGRLLWPLVEVTPTVSHLQGWAGVAIGASILAIAVGAVLQDVAGGLLVIGAVTGYVVGAALFVYSTWLSRREPG